MAGGSHEGFLTGFSLCKDPAALRVVNWMTNFPRKAAETCAAFSTGPYLQLLAAHCSVTLASKWKPYAAAHRRWDSLTLGAGDCVRLFCLLEETSGGAASPHDVLLPSVLHLEGNLQRRTSSDSAQCGWQRS